MPDIEGIGQLEGTEMTALETFSMENIEYLQSIEGLKSDNWMEMQPLERLDVLRTLESRLAEIQGRPPLPVVAETMEEGLSGYFDGEALHVNAEHLENPDYRLEVIDTIAHEGRHAYQQYAIEHPGFHPNAQEVMYWAANERTYISGDRFGYEYYKNQPIELDAWRYGEMTRSIFRETPGDDLFWESDSMELMFAKVENDPRRSLLFDSAGDLCSRIRSELDSLISPSMQLNILQAGAMAPAYHHS